MDFADTATEIGTYLAGIVLIGSACFGLHLAIKSFSWGRKVAK